MLKEALDLVSVPPDRSRQRWNTEASSDNIRQFAWSIGDDNPLWIDPEYGRASSYGQNLAPPTFLYTIDSTSIFPGLKGLARLTASAEWEWYSVLREGEKFVPDAQYTDAKFAVGRKAGNMIIQEGVFSYANADGEPVAKSTARVFRTARAPVDGGLNYQMRCYRYTPKELDDIEQAVLAETRRGAETLYWEDVPVGEDISQRIKGPMTVTDLICWYAGNGVFGRRPLSIAWRELFANPDFYSRRGDTWSYEYSERGHYDMEMAREVGMPGGYDTGHQRTQWFGHMLTDWMGDAGFLSRLSCKSHLPIVIGDTVFVRGSVVSKRPKEGSAVGIIGCDLVGVNQLGEVVMEGSAEVQLQRHDG